MKQHFKRSTAWMLCLALLLGLFAGVPGAIIASANAAGEATVEEKNLLADYNPSFEEYAIPNWTITPGAAQSSEKAADEWSLKISVKDASATSDAITAVAGYNYIASAMMFGAGKITVVFYDANGDVIGEASAENTTTQWAAVKAEGTAPVGTVKAAVKLAATTAEAVYFDNAALVMGAAGEPELLNGNFDGAWNAAATIPSQWEVTQPTSGTAANTYAFSAQEEIEGRGKVLAFNRENQKLQFASKKFDVIGGKAYTVTFDVWMSVANNVQIYIQMWDAEGTKVDIPVNKHGWTHDMIGENFPTNEWKTISATTALPANIAKARVLITAPWAATGEIKFDNFNVELSKDVIDGSYEGAPNRVGQAFGYTSTSTSTVRPWINTNADYVRTGNQSIAFTDGGWNYTNYINVIPGETYKSTIYIKSTAEAVAGWTSSLVNLIYFYDAAGNELYRKQGGGQPTSDAWTAVEATATAPEGAAFAKVMFYSAGGCLCYGDDITFVKTSDSSEALANAGFETREKVATAHTVGGGTSYVYKWLLSADNNLHSVVYSDAEHGYSVNIKSGRSLWTDFIPVTAGETYRFSIEMKGEGRLQAILYYYTEDATGRTQQMKNDKGANYGKTITPDLTGEWTTYTHETVAPQGATKALIWLVSLDSSDKTISGNAYADNVTLSKVCEHDFTGAAVETAPTCGTEGASVVTCPDCGATSTTVIAATGAHAWGEGVVTEPTCNKGGYTTYTCTACGETKIADETAAGNHSWNEGVYTAPTTEADGYTTYTCTLCGATKVEVDDGSMLVETAEVVRNGVVVGTYYTVAEALQNLQDGDTINLLADTDEGFNLPATGVNNITFNGNDFTVSGVIRVQHTAETATGLTIQNVVFDASESTSYLVISLGMHEDLTIDTCTFQNGAYISTYNTTGVKNLTINGCIFDGVTNANGTASAIILSRVENATITNNDILSVEWNAIQAGYGTGTWEFSGNNIVWDCEADGAYNLHSFENAKITISDNTYELNGNQNNIVNVQVAATNVALFCYDDVKVNTALFTEVNGNVYCTGHVDVDGVCSICGTASGPATDANLKFNATPGLSFKDYIGMQILVSKALADTYDRVWIEAVQADPAGDVTTILEGVPYYYNFYLKFEQQVLSWSMAENITLTLYAEKNGKTVKGETFSASVEELALDKIATYAASNNTKAVTALVDMLNYGAAVQTSFNHNADMLPNTKLGSYTGTTATPTFNATNSITGSGKLTVASNSISMQAKVEIQLLIMGKIDGYTVSAKVGGAAAPVVVDTEKYAAYGWTLVKVAVAADKMRQTYTISINDANGTPVTQVYNVSVEAYGKTQLSGARADVVIAMMRYGDSVAAL